MFEAELLCDRIGIIDSGSLVALDTPSALKRLAVGLYVVEALTEELAPGDIDAVRGLEGVGAIDQVVLGARTLVQIPTVAPEETSQAIEACLGSKVLELRTRNATLEDAYVRLVGGGAR